jgi:hypothetical protein
MRSAIFDAVVVRDLLNEMNDVAPELGLLDPHERLGKRKSVRNGEEVAHVTRRGRRAISERRSRWRRRAVEEERHRHLQDVRDVLEAVAPIRFVPFSYFCTCWNVRPRASPSVVWLMLSVIRRMRTRAPTCLSVGSGVPFVIMISKA